MKVSLQCVEYALNVITVCRTPIHLSSPLTSQQYQKWSKLGFCKLRSRYTYRTPFDVISVRDTAITKTDVPETKYVADAEIPLIKKLTVEQLRIVSTVARNIMPIPRSVILGNRRRKFRG